MKTIALLLSLLFTTLLFSQNIQATWNITESPKTRLEKVLFEKDGKFYTQYKIKKQKFIHVYNTNNKKVLNKEISFPNKYKIERIETILPLKNHIYIFFEVRNDNGGNRIYMLQKINYGNLSPSGSLTTFRTIPSQDAMTFAISKDQSKISICQRKGAYDGKNNELSVDVYDSEFTELWSNKISLRDIMKNYDISSSREVYAYYLKHFDSESLDGFSKITVSNSGNILMILRKTDVSKHDYHLNVRHHSAFYLTKNDDELIKFSHDLENLLFRGKYEWIDNHLVYAGTYSAHEIKVQKDKEKTYLKGIFAMSIDVNNKSVDWKINQVFDLDFIKLPAPGKENSPRNKSTFIFEPFVDKIIIQDKTVSIIAREFNRHEPMYWIGNFTFYNFKKSTGEAIEKSKIGVYRTGSPTRHHLLKLQAYYLITDKTVNILFEDNQKMYDYKNKTPQVEVPESKIGMAIISFPLFNPEKYSRKWLFDHRFNGCNGIFVGRDGVISNEGFYLYNWSKKSQYDCYIPIN